MSITLGQNVLASDFINEASKDATPANDAGRVPKLESDGQLGRFGIQKYIRNGGDGSDGALSISSGTTNIDLGSARIVTKNYTSFSITGTAKITFTNPHSNGTIIVIKSQSGFTLTSSQAPMIDASGLGGAAGTGVTVASGAAAGTTNGNDGTKGIPQFGLYETNIGTGTGGGGAVPTFLTAYNSTVTTLANRALLLARILIGAGGASGQVRKTSGTASATTGAGGRGGGALIMETPGSWNFTTAGGISVGGAAGSNASGSAGSSSSLEVGGGGGGGGGFFAAFVGAITANTGSVTKTGGAGGTGVEVNFSGSGIGGGGGGGASAGSGGAASSGNHSGGAGGDGVDFGVMLNSASI